MLEIDDTLAARLYDRARGGQWGLSTRQFAEALAASAARAFSGRNPAPRDMERYLASLHLEDLALARACAAGNEAAWEHVVREVRPVLYRAADALDPSGGARDLADGLYAELFGLREKDGERQSLFRYFHGRSSLTTWLRAVLAQRHVDRQRAGRRLEALPDEGSHAALMADAAREAPARNRYVGLMRNALGHALAALAPRDRLRLGCYYGQDLTLAQTGRLLGEHEATVSRQLARTRKAIRAAVERELREGNRLSDAEIQECFDEMTADAGPLDLGELLGKTPGVERKDPIVDRSKR